jgi:signal transduction histidine kinase
MLKKSNIAFLYSLGITTVIALIIGNQIFAHYLLKDSETDANVINLAGKQRMLSQQIALEAHKSLEDFSRYEIVKNKAELWENTHNSLRNGDKSLSIPNHNSIFLNELYDDIDQHIEVMVHLVNVAENQDELAAFVDMISSEAAQFLPKMDNIVNQLQIEAEERHASLEIFEILMTLLSVLILGVEFIFIFRPVIDELGLQNKRLQKMNLSKDRLMSTIAHDLRNPINGIQGMVQLVRGDLQDHMTSDHDMMFDLVDDACNKSTDLIQELLEISVLENEEFKIDREKTILKEYLLQTISHFQDRAKQKGVDLNVEVEKDVLTVAIDQKRFGRVIDNLLTNALKFTSAPGQVSIESYETDKSVIVKVKDSGIGIPKDMQQHIFDKFSKARRQGLEGEQSTGLGMSIVKQIVELHKGKIWVESAENVGTEFFIELPKVA